MPGHPTCLRFAFGADLAPKKLTANRRGYPFEELVQGLGASSAVPTLCFQERMKVAAPALVFFASI